MTHDQETYRRCTTEVEFVRLLRTQPAVVDDATFQGIAEAALRLGLWADHFGGVSGSGGAWGGDSSLKRWARGASTPSESARQGIVKTILCAFSS